jgi:MerR family transcriptional regulator, light-induced transcriptional regulator
MKSLLTPRELADAIGASESSVRRWVDAGHIPMTRTAGGHRRIALDDALRYLRQTQAQVVRPEVLGLQQFTGPAGAGGAGSEEQALYDALAGGETLKARGIILSLYLAGRSVSRIFDGPLRSALQRLASHGARDLAASAVERRANDILVQAVSQLRLLLAADAQAPLAMGGSPPGDKTAIPSMLSAATLADAGFREQNFGPETPLEPLGQMALDQHARLVWLNISATADADKLVAEVDRLGRRLNESRIPLMLGGKLVRDFVVKDRPNLHVVGSFAELGAFARGILAGEAPVSSK